MNAIIPGTNYSIHDDGAVFNNKTLRFVKPQSNGRYYKVTLSVDGKERQYLVHRLVAIAFIPNPYNKPEVNHINGNRFNNRVENLEWVTASENQIHSVKTNLKKHGTDLWNGKFTKEQVLEIISRKHNGESCRKLGKEFGVDATTISAISRGLRYKQYFEEEELQHALKLCGIEKEIVL